MNATAPVPALVRRAVSGAAVTSLPAGPWHLDKDNRRQAAAARHIPARQSIALGEPDPWRAGGAVAHRGPEYRLSAGADHTFGLRRRRS